MPFKSQDTVPIPITSIPTLVFGSPDAPLPDTPILLSTNPSPHSPFLTVSSYRLLSQHFAAGLLRTIPNFARGDRVMVASPNSVYMAVTFMGTIMAGGVFVGAPPDTELSHLLNQTKPRVLLVAEVLREKADGALASLASSSSCSHQDGDLTQFTFDDRVDEKALRNAAAITNSNRPKGCSAISVVSGLASNNVGKAAADINSTNKEGGVESRHWTSLLTAGAPASPSTTPFAWDDPPTHSAMRARTATLLSTSSTSGTPKQVRMSHYQFVAMTVVILDGFRRGLFASQSGNVTAPSKIGTAPPSLYHVSMTRIAAQSMACVIYPILRMPVYISESPLFVDILDCVIKLQLTGLFNSSHFIVALLKEEGLRKRWKDCGKSLRDLSLASVPVDDSMVEGFLEEWRRETGKDLEVRVSYGMTELGGAVASSRFCDRDNSEVNDLIPNVEAKVMDLDGQSELLPGEEGELWFRSPTVAEGYWANEEATKGAFMDDGWFRTGDIGTITGKGKLKALGRKDDLIYVANRYMLPLRPERVLLGHPDIKEAVVCGIEDRSEETDESTSTPKSQLLRAYIIRRGSTSLDEATVVNYAAQAAPDLPRIDGGVVFPDKIPRIAADYKPLRKALLAEDEALRPLAEQRHGVSITS